MKVILDKSKCIGCGSCVSVCEKFFELKDDGKSHLKKSISKEKSEKEILEISELECIKEAAEVCPGGAIEIKNRK